MFANKSYCWSKIKKFNIVSLCCEVIDLDFSVGKSYAELPVDCENFVNYNTDQHLARKYWVMLMKILKF